MGAFHRRHATTWSGRVSRRGSRRAPLGAEVVPLLGVRPLLGRAFTPDRRSRRRAGHGLLLATGCGRTRFGGDPGVLGRKVLLDDEPYTVIGVMPRGLPLSAPRDASCGRPLRFAKTDFEDRSDDLGSTRRAAAAGRVARAGARRDARSSRRSSSASTRRRTPGRGATVIRLRDEMSQAVAAPAPRPLRRGARRAPDRVHEPREPPARARARAPQGARGADGDGRRARAARPPAHHREPDPRGRGRRSGRAARGRGASRWSRGSCRSRCRSRSAARRPAGARLRARS